MARRKDPLAARFFSRHRPQPLATPLTPLCSAAFPSHICWQSHSAAYTALCIYSKDSSVAKTPTPLDAGEESLPIQSVPGPPRCKSSRQLCVLGRMESSRQLYSQEQTVASTCCCPAPSLAVDDG